MLTNNLKKKKKSCSGKAKQFSKSELISLQVVTDEAEQWSSWYSGEARILITNSGLNFSTE